MSPLRWGKICLLLWVDKNTQQDLRGECVLVYIHKWSVWLLGRRVSVDRKRTETVRLSRKTLQWHGPGEIVGWIRTEALKVMRSGQTGNIWRWTQGRIEYAMRLKIFKDNLKNLSLNDNVKISHFPRWGNLEKEQVWGVPSPQEGGQMSFHTC